MESVQIGRGKLKLVWEPHPDTLGVPFEAELEGQLGVSVNTNELYSWQSTEVIRRLISGLTFEISELEDKKFVWLVEFPSIEEVKGEAMRQTMRLALGLGD